MFDFPTDLKTDERGLANDVKQLQEMVHTLSNAAYNFAENPTVIAASLMGMVPDEVIEYILKAHECVCTCDKQSEAMGVVPTWSLPIPTQGLN